MNLEQLQARLLARIGSPVDSGAPTPADLTFYLNAAYLDIADRFRFHRARNRCRFNTEAGVHRYSIPAEAKSIFRVMNVTKGYKLDKRGDRYLASNSPATELTNLDESVTANDPPRDTWGQPTWYVRYRDYLDLQPIPDGIYTIEIFYKYDIAELALPDDIPVLPRSWHYGIVILGAWYYYDERKDVPKKTDQWQSFQQWVDTKPNEIDEESVDIDVAVEIPTLENGLGPRQDFNHAD